MNTSRLPVVFALAALVGCAAPHASEISVVEASAPTVDARGDAAVSANGAAPQDAALADAVSAPAQSVHVAVHGDALELWNDARFQRHFAESYLAETDVEPKLTDAEVEKLQKVAAAIAADDLAGALTLLSKQRGPAASAVVDFTVGNLHFQRDELDQAAEAYFIAVDKYPKFRRAWRNLGLIHVRRGEFGPAVDALARVVELGGGDALTYGLLGYAHSNVGNQVSAESAYRMALLLDPLTIDWKMGLARSFFEQKRYADAAALCDQLINANPQRVDLWLLQANAFIGLEQPLRAAQNYEIVETLGGSTTDSLVTLADIHANEGLFDLAVERYVLALERDPEAPADRALRAARLMAARGAADETRHLIARVEELRGDVLTDVARKQVFELRARLAEAEQATAEQVAALEQIVALDPLDGGALVKLGQIAGRAGEIDRAIMYFERAAMLEAFEADAKVRHAQLLAQHGRAAEALPLLRRAQAIEPRDSVQKFLDDLQRSLQ
jgi:tetratricopeptide (TPR) repeat protein